MHGRCKGINVKVQKKKKLSIGKKIGIAKNIVVFTFIGWFLITFMITPIIGVITTTFISEGSFTLDTFTKLASSSRVRNALFNTYSMTFWTVITVSIIGFFQIMVTEYFEIKGSRIAELAFLTPLVYSSISVVTGYNYVYSSTGTITKFIESIYPAFNEHWFTGFTGVLFVHTFTMTSFHILFVKSAFKRVDNSTIEAAKSLGVSSFTAFLKVALPVVKPAIFTATILLTLGSLNSFAAPSMLGGKNFYMISSMILNLNGLRSYDLASLLSLILAISCIILLLVMNHLEKRNSYISVSKVPTKLRKTKIRNPILNAVLHFFTYLLTAVYLLPVVLLVIISLGDVESINTYTFPKSFSLDNYIRVLSNPVTLKPFINSIQLSFIAVVVVLFISVASSFAIKKHPGKATKILELTLLLPWVLPATLLAVGMITTYSQPHPLVFNQILLGGFWLLPAAYVVFQIPASIRLVRSSMYLINDSHEQAARSLGASAFYTFRRVVLPVIFPTIISVGAISFNSLLSEYTVSALLYNINNVPLGIVLRRPELSSDPNVEANSLVYIVVLMIISSLTLYFTQRYNKKIENK